MARSAAAAVLLLLALLALVGPAAGAAEASGASDGDGPLCPDGAPVPFPNEIVYVCVPADAAVGDDADSGRGCTGVSWERIPDDAPPVGACLPGPAASVAGDARGLVAVTGTGDADGAVAASGTGTAEGLSLAVSGTGDSYGSVAVSGSGQAHGFVAVSGCDLGVCGASPVP